MAKTSNIVKKNFKYEVQKVNRCRICGRNRGYLRKFGIKNGYMAGKEAVEIPYSKLTLAICTLLSSEGYLAAMKHEGNKIMASLKYERGSIANRRSALTDLKRISKPGLRVYKGSHNLPYVLNGIGIAIISTPKGIMTDKQARKEGVGGEILAYVW